VENSAPQRFPIPVRTRRHRHIEHRLEGGELTLAPHQRNGAELGLGHLLMAFRRRRGDVYEH
jgi:hypothetical protein